MIKVLVVGISESVGGIETLFRGLFGTQIPGIDVSILTFHKKCAFEELFLQNNYKVYHLPSRKKAKFSFNKIIKNFFKQNNDFDFVWFNTASTSMYQIQYYAKKYTKAKVITHSHGTSFDKNNGNIYYTLNKILSKINRNKVLKNTDLFFCCSIAAGQALFGKNYTQKLHLVKNGINAENYIFNEDDRKLLRNQFNINKDTTVVSLIGRLSHQKNPLMAIEIFEEYIRINSNSIMLIVGEGELEDLVRETIKQKNLNEKVIMIGFRNDVEKIMSCSDILLMPSLFEGLPLTAIEAQCNGLTCFLSDTITTETRVTSSCHFIHLDDTPEKWAYLIDNIYRPIQNRANSFEQIISAEYSIKQTREYVYNLLGEFKL